MATASKPRRATTRRSKPTARGTATTGSTLTGSDRFEQAKKIAQQARRKAGRIANDEKLNRTTRARAALKVKADALDEIAALK